MRYLSRLLEVDAFQWPQTAPQWLQERLVEPDPYDWKGCLSHGQACQVGHKLAVCVQEGILEADVGDWIVLGAKGELLVLNDASFRAAFNVPGAAA